MISGMNRLQVAGALFACIVVLTASSVAGAATTPPDNSNTCPAIGKTVRGIEKRPCRPGSVHKIAVGVDKKYSPLVGVKSTCLTPDREAQYLKDHGANCTVEYCTPLPDGKEKCTKKTVAGADKSGMYKDISPYIQQAQADGSRVAAYTAMTDVAAAHKTGNTGKVEEIANLTKLNPSVNSLINSAFTTIQSTRGAGGSPPPLSDQDKINAVIANLDSQQQPLKDVPLSLNDSIPVDISVLEPPKDNATAPCPSSAPCNPPVKTTPQSSTFPPPGNTGDVKKTAPAQPPVETSWLGTITNKVSDLLPASVNRWLGLANTPAFRPYDPNTDVPVYVNENNAPLLKDQIHLNPFDPDSPVVLTNKDIQISGGESALQSITKRQTQAVQTADIDPDTPVPSGGIVVTPLGADGKPDVAASQVMECNTWRCFLNEVKSNDKYNNTVISVNIPNQENKNQNQTQTGLDVVTTPFEELPATVKKVLEKQDELNKSPIVPPKVADNPPPGTDSPTLASTPPAGNPQNENPKEQTAPPAPQPPAPPVEQSAPPEPTQLPPAPPEVSKESAPQKETPKTEEPKPTEEKPVTPSETILSSPTKSPEAVPTPLPEPELKDKLPVPEEPKKEETPKSEPAVQPTLEAFYACKDDYLCRQQVLNAMLEDLQRPRRQTQQTQETPKEPPKESSPTSPSRSSLSGLSSSYPRYVPGESSESFQKKVDAWWEQSSNQSLEDFINSRGGRVGQCEGCHNPQMGGGAGPSTDYKGIGIRIQYERKEVDGKALPGGMILSVFPNTPAEQAGLRPGDFLLTLDGGKTSMISGIKGEPGTSIKVRYVPQGATTPKTVTVTRAVIRCSVYGCP